MSQPQGSMDTIKDALAGYFAGGAVGMVDPLWNKMMEGFMVEVSIRMWSGWVRLEAADWGLSPEAYSSLDLRWGRINILEPGIRTKLHNLATNIRRLPVKWGRVVRGSRYIPLSAMGRFRKEFDELQIEWTAAIADWLNRYDEVYAYAQEQVDALADKAAVNAERLEEAGTLPDEDTMIQRILDMYPLPETIRDDFVVTYSINVIPTPQLVAQQAADLELIEAQKQDQLRQQREEAERRAYEHEEARTRALASIDLQQKKLEEHQAIIKAERERLQADLEQKRQQLLDEFYTGYALDIRQRLHEALMFVVEGVRNGKLSPSSARSLRTVLNEVKDLALDDDQEIQQMEQRLSEIMDSVEKRKTSPAEMQGTIEDFGMLLQTSILAMGDQPRMPKRQGQEIRPQDSIMELPADALLGDTVRQARQRTGLDTSLAEILVDAGGLSLDILRNRRQVSTGALDLAELPDGG